MIVVNKLKVKVNEMKSFVLDRATKFEYTGESKPVETAINILKRDIEKVCTDSISTDVVKFVEATDLEEEAYKIVVTDESATIYAADDLGFEYALLFLSREYLGVEPFWFWNEQKLDKKGGAVIPSGSYESRKPIVRYRGWFYNDEVLMMGWPLNQQDKLGWRMAFEALLRCGGNMAIPGTDKMARENLQIAAQEYGLWITHHHAEPLGGEMFARAYPDLEADYFKHPDLFKKIWEDAVITQKDYKVVWNLCFRGQGDCPFWANDKTGAYDTDEKRGKVISDLIKIQADIVKKHVENPIFCTNLYGEIMELYEQGYVTFPENIILVRADNGYGRMVTRRRGNHNPRVNAMPDPTEKRRQGIYYHASFYDLQAAAQLSMLPNSVNFVNAELNEVIKNGGDDFWVINCSNVKPHTYFLDAIAKKWYGEEISDSKQSADFAKSYYGGDEDMAQCYRDFHEITPSFGDNIDEHAGEQFYNENIRYFASYILKGKTDSIKELQWYTGDVSLAQQLEKFAAACREKLDAQEDLLSKIPDNLGGCQDLRLQVRMHYCGTLGVVFFADGYEKYLAKDYAGAFLSFGKSADCFSEVDIELKKSTTGVWQGFYDNECQADFKFTAYLIRKLMGLIRELGDNSEHYKWQYEYLYSKEDKEVKLILLTQNHATDEEIYRAMLMRENLNK